ncbi:helix-turn-helix domain-containing protein [Streptomyces sp. NPDC090445]|uniref:helix-turn-helix domain-containing protein n=1 Tax=Streptomyces sp. NPDC090445 TaxID=3365963 RepID=UPI00380B2B48
MAYQHPSAGGHAQSRIPAGSPRSGVIHVNVPHDSHFVVVGNDLAQHRKLSLTARGLAVYIQSLPEGAPISIKALAWQLNEGEYRIAKALRELEEHGYLARLRARLPSGQILTPAVSLWLARGVLPFAITLALSDDIPRDLRHPAGLVAYRLRELLPAPVPESAPTPPGGPASGPRPDLPGDRPRPHPLQVCVRCDSISFRAPEPGLCNPCKREEKDAA